MRYGSLSTTEKEVGGWGEEAGSMMGEDMGATWF